MPGYDPNRPWRHLYGKRWQKLRLRHLAKHPLCVKCGERGRVTAANVVDHITPHKGDVSLFWNERNWQSLCEYCHNGDKQREERAPPMSAVDGYSTRGEW